MKGETAASGVLEGVASKARLGNGLCARFSPARILWWEIPFIKCLFVGEGEGRKIAAGKVGKKNWKEKRS